MSGLINDDLLNSTDTMWRSIRQGGKLISNKNYRFGVKYDSNIDGAKNLVYHEGKHENVRTIMAFYPETNFGVASHHGQWRLCGCKENF